MPGRATEAVLRPALPGLLLLITLATCSASTTSTAALPPDHGPVGHVVPQAPMTSAAAAPAAGTSSPPPSPTSPTSATSASAPSAASGTGPTAAGRSASATSSPGSGGTHATAAACTSGDLSISAGTVPVGLGHEGSSVHFRNTGSSTCVLSGYPGVALLGPHGAEIEQAQRTLVGYLAGTTTTVPAVELPPGGTASALVEGNLGGSCPATVGSLVTAPGATVSVRLSRSLDVHCHDLEVHPVVAGEAGELSR